MTQAVGASDHEFGCLFWPAFHGVLSNVNGLRFYQGSVHAFSRAGTALALVAGLCRGFRAALGRLDHGAYATYITYETYISCLGCVA